MDTLAQMGGVAAPVPLVGQPQLVTEKKTSLAACEQQNHEDSSLYIYFLILTGGHFFIDSREREEG